MVIPITMFTITIVLYAVVMMMPLESRIDLYMPKSNSKIEGWEERAREKIIERHHLNKSFAEQYFYWVKSLFEGEWGYSPVLQNTILPELLRRTPVTIELIIYSLLLQIPLGLFFGIASASRKGSPIDISLRLVSSVATSLPDFILAIILLAFFYVGLSWFPPERLSVTNHMTVISDHFKNYTGLITIDGFLNNRVDITFDAFRHLVLPVFTLSFAHWAILYRITRVQLLEELQKEYITSSLARGLHEKTIVRKHAFPNALGPVLSSSAVSAAAMVSGVYVVERIFNLKGVSDLITRYGSMVPDAAAVLGFAVYSTLIVLMLMLTLDILQAILLPQIKEETLSNEHF